MHTGPVAPRLRFGRFEFDRASGELFRDGARVRLQEQPGQILAALLEQPGEVVTREDLRARLWGADTFVDFEHGLNTAVKKLRQALGDAADAPEFVETLARRGYRFIGRLEPAAPAGDSPAVPAAAAPPSSSVAPVPRGRGWLVWATATILIAMVAALVWAARRPARPAASATGTAATAQLAVMPFRVLPAAGKDLAYLGIGLADAITTRLAGTRQIGLRPTAAILPFADRASDPANVAAALGVEHLLIGTIQPGADTYRITVQLVRADGVAIWGDSYDEPRAALIELQDRVAAQVAGALRVELAGPGRSRRPGGRTTSPAAYELYLRGRSLLLDYTEAKMREAIALFERALAMDEHDALARTGIATACAWFSVRYAHDAEQTTWARRADDEARRALEDDASLAEAHLARASAAGTAYGGFDWKLVLDRTGTALLLDPSLDLAHLARMRAFYHLGRFEDAGREGRAAAALNPGHNVELLRLEVAVLLFDGRFAEAVDRAEALQARTDAPAVRHYLGLARHYTGDAHGARTMLASIRRGDEPDTRAQAALASVEAATGLSQEARKRIAAILRAKDHDHHVAYSVGAAFAQLGDTEASLTWLERAADTGFPCYPWFAQDRMLEPIRNTPRFARLLDRLKTAMNVSSSTSRRSR